MVESYLRQTPLAHLGLEGRAREARGEAGVALGERPLPGIVDVRGNAGDSGFMGAFEAGLGFALPVEPNTTAGQDGARALWLGPDEWWIVTPGAAPGSGWETAVSLRAALSGHVCAITEVSDSRACVRLSGPHARAVLEKGCPLDFHAREFAPGQCAQSHLAKAGVMLHRLDDDPGDDSVFDIYVLRSFADYLWRWLEDAAREFGLTVVKG